MSVLRWLRRLFLAGSRVIVCVKHTGMRRQQNDWNLQHVHEILLSFFHHQYKCQNTGFTLSVMSKDLSRGDHTTEAVHKALAPNTVCPIMTQHFWQLKTVRWGGVSHVLWVWSLTFKCCSIRRKTVNCGCKNQELPHCSFTSSLSGFFLEL